MIEMYNDGIEGVVKTLRVMYSGCSEVVVKGHMVCHILRLLSFVVLIYVR